MTSILHYYPPHPSRHSPQRQPTHRGSYIDDNGSGDSSNEYTYGQLGTLPFGGYQAHPVFDDTFGGMNENLSVGNINSFQFHPEGQPRSFSLNNGVNYNINSMLNQPVTLHAQATRLSGYSQPQVGAVQHRGNGKYRNVHADASSVSQYPSSANQRRKWQVCAAAPSDAPNQPQMGPFQPPKENGYNAALNSQPSYSKHPTSTNQQYTAPPSSSRSQPQPPFRHSQPPHGSTYDPQLNSQSTPGHHSNSPSGDAYADPSNNQARQPLYPPPN
jgi:hypothetical protein